MYLLVNYWYFLTQHWLIGNNCYNDSNEKHKFQDKINSPNKTIKLIVAVSNNLTIYFYSTKWYKTQVK